MSTTELDPAPLKEIQKFLWTQGDYAPFSAWGRPAADAIVAAAGVAAGQDVLDVAAGDGNAALAAARAGAHVTATDLTPAMVELGRARTAAEGADVSWQEADAEALPFADASFDIALSAFGAIFAPRAAVAAAELLRVVRPGGAVALATWAAGSLPLDVMAATFRYVPPPPPGASSALDWADEGAVRERLTAAGAASVGVERRTLRMDAPDEDAWWDAYDRLGPMAASRMILADRYDALAQESRALVREAGHTTDAGFTVEADYLVVVARRAG